MNGLPAHFFTPGDIGAHRIGQIWDPTLGAYRSQRLPIALSKSSVARIDDGDTAKAARASYSLNSASTSLEKTGPTGPSRNLSSNLHSHSSAHSLRNLLIFHRAKALHVTGDASKTLSPNWCKDLPPEVYDCILDHLKIIHEVPISQGCQTCHLRDLYSLALTSRTWDKAVAERMYGHICIVGHESKQKSRRPIMGTSIRLKLLRRTLRDRANLAQHVRELKVPWPHCAGDSIGVEMINVVASLVMITPNLERLVGFHPTYSHEFDRLTHALSTRSRLKTQVWFIGDNDAITLRSYKHLAPGLMDPHQKSSFISFHQNWQSLTTLFLHSPGEGILERDVFISIFRCLPSLKHLRCSNFDEYDFNDQVLQYLPNLLSLRLQDLEGITYQGLSEFSRTRSASAMQNLSLVNLDILYMSAISSLLLRMKALKRLTLVQDTSPEIEEGEIVFQPVIASHSLQYVHWDIIVPGSANRNLANSIKANGFPQLRTIRAPSDHNGLLQALCKPISNIGLPTTYPISFTSKGNGSTSSLRSARLAAQRRIEEAWSTVDFRVVIEEEGVVNEIFDLSGFVGTIGSSISYTLDPDVPGSDAALIDFSDLTSSDYELGDGACCEGQWNASHPRGSKWWQHINRPRYHAIDLCQFF